MSKMPSHEPKREPDFEPFVPPKKRTVYMELGNGLDEGRKEKPVRLQGEISSEEIAVLLKDIEGRISKNEDTELTQSEASLIYQVDRDLPYTGIRPDSDLEEMKLRTQASWIKILRGWRSDMGEEEIRELRDYEQVKSLIIERMRSEKYVVQTASALGEVAKGLGLDPVDYAPHVYMQILKETMNDWEQRGIYDFLTQELMVNNTRYDIVPVPNVEVDYKQIFELTVRLEDQPSEEFGKTGINREDFYRHYSPQDLCGKPGVGPFRLRLVPTSYNHVIPDGRVVEQSLALPALQAARPEHNLAVPSVLESTVYWYVMRAGGAERIDMASYDKSYTRHFDLKPQLIEGDMYVPDSYLDDGGFPSLYLDDVENYRDVRLSVG